MTEYEAGKYAAIRELFSLLEVDGSDFYYNESNDYGCITFKWFCGEGDPFERFRGEETKTEYYKRGLQGTGRYKLNSTAVDVMLEALKAPTTK